ncbi:MAG: zinc ABC transporter substrate-binding protein [Alphaproteobacteria bacterium]
MRKLVLAVVTILWAAVSAQAAEPAPAPAAASEPPIKTTAPLRVVASFSILGDMVENIGGELVTVKTLVGPGGDAHSYQPTPADLKAIAEAQLVVVNGLGFEGWMSRLLESAGYKKSVVTASKGVEPRLIFLNESGDEVQRQITDPHAWQNLENGQRYAANIAMALVVAMPDKALALLNRADKYQSEIGEMDKYIRGEIEAIPAPQRTIITSHDAFGYFGEAYGIRFLAPYSANMDTEPSAANIGSLVTQIKSEGVKTVFIENMTNPKLISQLAADAGAKIGGTLYADALSGKEGTAPSYLGMFKNNVPLLKAAMLENKKN